MMADRSTTTRNALVILAVIAGGAALWWMQAILTPLAIAIFLLIMVDGFARLLGQHARWLPEWAALPTAITLMLIGLGVTILIVAENAAGFTTQLVRDSPRLNVVLAQGAALVGVRVPPTVASLADQLNPTRYLGEVVAAMRSFGAGALYALIYLGFLIASRSGFRRKALALFPDLNEFQSATAVFIRIRDGTERYLWIQTCAAFFIATGSWVAMAALGLSNAVFWAFLIFVAAYIPVIGGFVGALLPPLFMLLQYEDPWRGVVLFGALQAVFFIIGSVIQPKMQKDGLNIDPVVVLLALTLWGAIWGVAGMFLSTPLTVMLIIVLAQFEGTRWIAILLSGDGQPEPIPRGGRVSPHGPSATEAVVAPSPHTGKRGLIGRLQGLGSPAHEAPKRADLRTGSDAP